MVGCRLPWDSWSDPMMIPCQNVTQLQEITDIYSELMLVLVLIYQYIIIM